MPPRTQFKYRFKQHGRRAASIRMGGRNLFANRGKATFRRAVRSAAEYRQFQASGAGTAADVDPLVLDISAIVQGDGRAERGGQRVQLEKLNFKATIFSNVTDTYERGRLIIFKWNEYSIPTFDQILKVVTNLECESNYEIKTTAAFKVLYDKRMAIKSTLQSKSQTDGVIITKALTHTIDLNLRKNLGNIAFDGTSTTVGKGKIFMFWFSNSVTAGAPTMDYVSALGFKDY